MVRGLRWAVALSRTLAERQKLFATLTYQITGKTQLALVVAIALLAGALAILAHLYWDGRYTVRDRVGALALITDAVENEREEDRLRMIAKFYHAKIYSDNGSGFTDHARAYGLLREIINQYSDADPKDYRVAPYVSKALVSFARYERDGIAALKLLPDIQRALEYFDHAASYFNNQDAQFELAKHYLAGDGVVARVPYALNWLQKLTKQRHVAAQAFLASVYWDGRYMKRDPVKALALITVAVENVREDDRFWIEDLHRKIFCAASRKTLKVCFHFACQTRQVRS